MSRLRLRRVLAAPAAPLPKSTDRKPVPFRQLPVGAKFCLSRYLVNASVYTKMGDMLVQHRELNIEGRVVIHKSHITEWNRVVWLAD